jgi:hypothetical protein
MNNYIGIILLMSVIGGIFVSQKYNGSTTAVVTLSGAIIKAQNTNVDKKYKRKDCPVCQGKGWYISGDKITKVDCGYCEADTSSNIQKSGTCKTITTKK